MEKNLYIDASHPDETRIVLKSEKYIEEYEYENKNSKLNVIIAITTFVIFLKYTSTNLKK